MPRFKERTKRYCFHHVNKAVTILCTYARGRCRLKAGAQQTRNKTTKKEKKYIREQRPPRLGPHVYRALLGRRDAMTLPCAR